MHSFQSLINSLVKLLDPFLAIDPKVRKRLEQVDFERVRSAFWAHTAIWPLIYIAHYHFNDQSKSPLSLYFKYRYGMASAILALGLAGYLLRNSPVAIRLCLLLLSGLLCSIQSWSMTLGPYISHSYLIWLPVIVIGSYARSFILSAAWLIILVCGTRIFWSTHTEVRFVFSDTMLAVFILFGIHLVRRVWLDSRALAFQNEDLRKEAFLAQQTFDKQIKSFISPVLVRNIESMTSRGLSFIAALDSVLKLRKSTVAVLFSDMRNFSTRSDDIDFVEKELIPSSGSIIDSAEQNGGIAKQIGDAVFVYYCLDDSEESLLRCMKDGLRCSMEELSRVTSLGRIEVERFFTITFGPAFVGNMASAKHREPTIIGAPANLAARIDALTKDKFISSLINGRPGILLDQSAWETIKSFSQSWAVSHANLPLGNIEIRSYPGQKNLFFLPACTENLAILNQLLAINSIPTLTLGGG